MCAFMGGITFLRRWLHLKVLQSKIYQCFNTKEILMPWSYISFCFNPLMCVSRNPQTTEKKQDDLSTAPQKTLPVITQYSKQHLESWKDNIFKLQQALHTLSFQVSYQNLDSIWRCGLTRKGNPTVEIRPSWDHLISKIGFPRLVRWHLYIESAPPPPPPPPRGILWCAFWSKLPQL